MTFTELNHSPADQQKIQQHTALKRWMAIDMRWNKNIVSRGSSVAIVRRRPNSPRNTSAFDHIGPIVSKARGTELCVVDSSVYLSSLREAASSAALPAVTDVEATYEVASVSATVTSHTAFLPACQGTRVSPSGRFPSVRNRPTGFYYYFYYQQHHN